MNRALRESVLKATLTPVQDLQDFEDELRRKLGLTNRYDTGRLAIGRSLAEPSAPEPLDRDAPRGTPIRGETLLGREVDLWISAIAIDNQFEAEASIEDFKGVLEAHWARGTLLLKEEWEACEADVTRFVAGLATLLPNSDARRGSKGRPRSDRQPEEVKISIGSVSRQYSSTDEVTISINGSGVSPHIALMGKTRSGKTTTGLQMAGQIAERAAVPILLIDPKGEFSDVDSLHDRLGFLPNDYSILSVGSQPIPLDFLPNRDLGAFNVKTAAMQLRDSIALACRASGDVQKDVLRTAIEQVINDGSRRDLSAIRDAYEGELNAIGKQKDSIVGRLNEVTTLQCFSPDMSMSEFFERSWVLSLNHISEELKRLVILLVLDSLKSYIGGLSDAPIEAGFRGLRNVLVVDEARRILAERKYESLVDLVRQGASKGLVVMLLSQDPSDFESQADDFTTQLGTVVAFACSQTEKGLRKLKGVYGRKVQAKEFSDTHLPTGVAFCKLPGRQPERIQCWEIASAQE